MRRATRDNTGRFRRIGGIPTGGSRWTPRALLLLAITGAAILGAASLTAGPSSSHYHIVVEETTSGGGPAAASYAREADSVIGQPLPYVSSASANFREESGILLPWPGPPGSGWITY